MLKRDKIVVTDATGDTLVGPGYLHAATIRCDGISRVYGTGNEDEAIDDTGQYFDPSEIVDTRCLPPAWMAGKWKFVCPAGETATIYWSTE